MIPPAVAILPTDAEIDAAILAAIDVAGDVVPWAIIRGAVPGAYWRKVERLVALHHDGLVDTWKHGGRTFVELPWPRERAA